MDLNRFVLIILAASSLGGPAAALSPCQIEVVEKGSDWPVPLVELQTTHRLRFVTDNAGIVVVDAPELMNREVWFDISSPGYEAPKDGFGYRGARLKLAPGGKYRVEVVRTIIARRLGRVTGAGIFGEAQKLGQYPDWTESGVFGCDSVQNAVYRGKLFWAWGDTTMPNYPLGIFDGTSATTPLRPLASFEPPLRLKLDYFKNEKGTPKAIAPMPGDGPTWLTGFVSLPDTNGAPHLVSSYLKPRKNMQAHQWGLAVWNDGQERFVQLRLLWQQTEAQPKPPLILEGQPAFWTDAAGKQWVLFGNPFPSARCPATFEAWQDTNTWESLQPQKSVAVAETGQTIHPHSGSIAWNPWRKRWVTVFMQNLGDLWYAEADAPTGPWGPAVKILGHSHYTFYNPRLHPEFTPDDSPILIFEGTYTREFSGNDHPTPRYDYNQVLYRLDLDDPRLKPAQPGK